MKMGRDFGEQVQLSCLLSCSKICNMNIHDILHTTKHRPWEIPRHSWKFYQEWNNAIFLHLEYRCKRSWQRISYMKVIIDGLFSAEANGLALHSQLYPNPATDILNVNIPYLFRKITIRDIAGSNRSEKIITRSNLISIDMQRLAPGIYLFWLKGWTRLRPWSF